MKLINININKQQILIYTSLLICFVLIVGIMIYYINLNKKETKYLNLEIETYFLENNNIDINFNIGHKDNISLFTDGFSNNYSFLPNYGRETYRIQYKNENNDIHYHDVNVKKLLNPQHKNDTLAAFFSTSLVLNERTDISIYNKFNKETSIENFEKVKYRDNIISVFDGGFNNGVMYKINRIKNKHDNLYANQVNYYFPKTYNKGFQNMINYQGNFFLNQNGMIDTNINISYSSDLPYIKEDNNPLIIRFDSPFNISDLRFTPAPDDYSHNSVIFKSHDVINKILEDGIRINGEINELSLKKDTANLWVSILIAAIISVIIALITNLIKNKGYIKKASFEDSP